jgi:hypothetical protein
MIQNRTRIEQQIHIGRKTVRKASQAKPDRQEGLVPGSTSTAPPATGSDAPLSVDSDAETAFANGKLWQLRRRAGTSPSSSGTPFINGDPLRVPLMRRRWATEHLDGNGNEDEPSSSPRSSNFLSRIRTRSFPALPGQEMRPNKLDRDPSVDDQAWSSDSSLEDDLSLLGRRNSFILEGDPT